ncbi:MAG: GNAT family N-acetyltransferase [Gemmatales bacterium]
MSWTFPAKIESGHLTASFDSGNALLDRWLNVHALKNEALNASRTYVTLDNNSVIGYYALATGSVLHPVVSRQLKRNMPDPLPLVVLARLAVDQRFQGFGLGKALLKDAIRRTIQVSDITGVCSLLVHAISEEAVAFYQRYGFVLSPFEPRTLFLRTKDARKAIA